MPLFPIMSGNGHHIYVHVPFCSARCPYCDFYSVTETHLHDLLRGRWLDLAARELDMWVAAGDADPAMPVRTVFFGGGTPSLLSPEAVSRFIARLRDRFDFDADAEVTMEMQPGTVDEEKVRDLATAGVNRFSTGVQSFDTEKLKALGRRHTADQARELIGWARKYGRVSIDLISALPGESLEQWTRELDEAIACDVPHISVYELTFHSGTVFSRRLERGELEQSDEDLRSRIFTHTERRLSAAGFRQYEISNYARTGERSRHNENYWLLGNSIGLGAGAHSYVFPERYANENDVTGYASAVESGHLFRKKLQALDPEVLTMENLYMALRLCEGVDLDVFAKHLPVDIRASRAHRLRELVKERLIEVDGARLRLTAEGRLRFDSVLEYLV